MRTFAFIMVFGLSFPVLGANQSVPITLNFEGDFDNVTRATLQDILNPALTMVKAFGPQTPIGNAFDWKGDASLIQGKRIKLNIVKTAALYNSFIPMLTLPTSIRLNVFLIATVDPKTRTVDLLVNLFYDRIFLKPNGREREDSFASLVMGLASQFFGPVQTFLQTPFDEIQPVTEETQQASLVQGHERAIEFTTSFLKSVQGKKFPSKVIKDFKRQLIEEQRVLKSIRENTCTRKIFDA